jgi:hypothetical protein
LIFSLLPRAPTKWRHYTPPFDTQCADALKTTCARAQKQLFYFAGFARAHADRNLPDVFFVPAART